MKKALCVLAILSVAAFASASVRLFVTSSADGYGLNETPNHNIASFSTVDQANTSVLGKDFYYSKLGAYPYYGGHTGFSVSNFPPELQAGGTALTPIEIQPTDFAYIWFQFQNEADQVRVKGLGITINDVTAGNVVAPVAALGPTYYYQNNRNTPTQEYRWEGALTQPGQPEFHNNPQVLVGVTSNGLNNVRVDNPWNMSKFQAMAKTAGTTTGVSLLGALDPTLRTGHVYEIMITPGDNGIEYNTGLAGPHVSGFFKFVPEPASLLLMGLAGLILRRR